jgi:hypothetical protein
MAEARMSPSFFFKVPEKTFSSSRAEPDVINGE